MLGDGVGRLRGPVGRCQPTRVFTDGDEHPPVDGVSHPAVGGAAEPHLAGTPGCLVTGASPVSASKADAEAKRSRVSPIPEISTAAMTGPIPGKLVKIGVSGVRVEQLTHSLVVGPQMGVEQPELFGECWPPTIYQRQCPRWPSEGAADLCGLGT